MKNDLWYLNLAGKWEMQMGEEEILPTTLPGCSYLALLENGKIEDPFWGCNEKEAANIAENTYRYHRTFHLAKEQLKSSNIDLLLSGVDTFASVWINGEKIGKTENAFRAYRFPVASSLKEGKNEIWIDLEAPHLYMKEKQEQRPLVGMDIGIPGVSYVRKPQYHFGWDWGPTLPPAGVSGMLQLKGYSLASLNHVFIEQHHEKECVEVVVRVDCLKDEAKIPMKLLLTATSPLGEVFCQEKEYLKSEAECTVCIKNPQLWWCNGLGQQPLYNLEIELQTMDGTCLDKQSRHIGLRTIELDRSKDAWGENFCFRINGHNIFAKGANWIPADSFADRITPEKLEFYIRSAKDSNMNMLRVWGGGFYESDLFYDLCDTYGILVWQDFAFACRAYPLDDSSFLENVHREVEDQVQRLHSHPSLALWCGNNELQLEELLWAGDRPLRKAIHTFFFETLPDWIKAIDTQTPYWYGSPSDKTPGKRANTLNCGDTHLWQIWHGLMPITAFRRYPTRFCSEFGLESLPSRTTIAAFTDPSSAQLDAPDMLNHQKSARGNEKLLFYVTARHPHPVDLDSTIYLTQIMQAEGIRSAVEFWHSRKGRCNGALYWQYNDCWPTTSWSGIDYLQQYKALQYWASSFYAPVSIVPEVKKSSVHILLINDQKENWTGDLKWKSISLQGDVVAEGSIPVNVDKNGVSVPVTIPLKTILEVHRKDEIVLCLTAVEHGMVTARRCCLLVPEKKISFTKSVIHSDIHWEEKTCELHLKCDDFAHYVYLSVEGTVVNFSDNFFDLYKGEDKVIQVTLHEDMEKEAFEKRLRICSYGDFSVNYTPWKDWWMRVRMRISLKGIKGWLMTNI